MSREAKFGGSIEGTKNPSVLTPPPYKNKQDYKCGTNDKTHDSHSNVLMDRMESMTLFNTLDLTH